jgi:hypothetical protein
LAELREAQQTNQLESRIKALEYTEFAARRDAAIKRMEDVTSEREEKLKSMVASAELRMADELNAAEQRKTELAEKIRLLTEKFNRD